MLTSTISDKGQTAVPARVRKALKAPPGTVLAWTVNGTSAEVVPLVKPNQRKRRIDFEAYIQDWKNSPAVSDGVLNVTRTKPK